MTRRACPPHLRVIVNDRPVLAMPLAEPAGAELDRALARFVQAGRNIIAAGVAAVVDTAAENDLTWDAMIVRDGITDVVTKMLHDDIVGHLGRRGVDPGLAAASLDPE